MPLYDFHCEACDATSELMVRASDACAPACPKCGSSQLSKLLSLPSAPGKIKGFLARQRAQANKEGHFSNCSASERASLLK
ncbi:MULTISPECIES: FmdB family zinc ribbon protein [Uliginosibacterium]|uniref:Zinc ribbon domain-containing protein n=1 Tax=Uliginosibacterium aquaticum TaxID=2731212 RepID=A0ABX2IE43_9RHOO|nr:MULTISPECIES: zinc ribbon domain-containing protein [Uliginosibacterium]MDO6385366.1 zinc ribbon domain-containing protein [Uliginosibacterium sp. 31-12]NSL54901.1 zinc ribbon domain-containing protein [Uliginosibacterium aquaticum]PLK47836.1 FmdB family transcriptional regulator [Uliginosibacterium sp. TH139]